MKVTPLRLSSLQRQDSDAPSFAESEHNEEAHLVRKQNEHKTVGRAALWEVAEIYRRMFIVIGPLLLCNFAYYSVWSHAIPDWLCIDPIKAALGTNKNFTDCVYVTDGDYSKNTARKVSFLMFWTAQWTWLTVFPALFGYCMFGRKSFRWYENLMILAINLTICLLTLNGTLVRGWAINAPILQLFLPVGTGFLVIFIAGRAGARFTNNPVTTTRWFMLSLVIGVATIFYAFAMPRLVTTRATQQQKLLVRLIIHPAIWAVMLMFMRHVGRHLGKIPGLLQVVFFTYPYMYKTVYGRFLLLQLSGGSSVIALNALTCVLDLIGRLATRNADLMLLRLMYGRRTAQAMLATDVVTQWRTAEIMARSLAEYVSIIGGGALFSFGKVTGDAGVVPNAREDWWLAAVQAVTFLITDVAGISIEMKFHQFKFSKHMLRRPTRMLAYLMVTQLFGSTRICTELMLLFCPRYYDGKGVLLEVCNQASVFDHLRGWRPGGDGL